MRKFVIQSAVIGLLFAAIPITMAVVPPKYWKDLLKIKPNTEWIEAYGFGDESFLANHAWRMEQLVEAHGGVIKELKKEIDLLKGRVLAIETRPHTHTSDPNSVVDPNDGNQ